MKTYKPISIWYALFALSAFAIILLATSGCSSTSYNRTGNDGEKINFSTSSLFTKRHIKDVEYGVTRGGTRRFRLKGYANDQTETMQAAIEAALRAYQSQRPPAPAGPNPADVVSPP